MKVRIVETPREQELDGVRLDGFTPGGIRDVSPSIGSWLIMQGYAEPEMRRAGHSEDLEFSGFRPLRDVASDTRRPRRRSTDR